MKKMILRVLFAMAKLILRVLFAMATMVALCGLYLIVNGSLEMLPTEEQIEKAHIAGWVLLLVGVVGDCVIGMILRILRRNRNN